MEFELKNLGAIKSGKIELKPLTVFIGPNNSGKTWASYAISGLFGQESWSVYREALMDGYLEETYPEIEQVIETFRTLGTAQINIADYFEKICEAYYNNLCKFAPKWMNAIMGTKSKIFDNFSISIDIREHVPSMKQRVINSELDFVYPMGTISEPLIKTNKKRGEAVLFFRTSEDRSLTEIQPDVLKNYIYGAILQVVHRAYIDDVRYLTAERTGLFPFMSAAFPVSRRLRKNAPLEKEQFESMCFSYPLEEMLTDLIELKDAMIHDKIFARRNNEKYKPLQELADILEGEILEGKIERKVIPDVNVIDYIYRHDDAKEIGLEMTVVSSAVKDSSPLSLYLRYILKPRDLVLIDEPEMNLHPENQVKMLELLAMLVNLNVNVIITTHSTYFVDHLVNLMKAAEHSTPEKIKDKFYLKSEKAFISKESVAVYVFEENTARSILSDKGFIDWDTFSDVSQYVANLYPEIAED